MPVGRRYSSAAVAFTQNERAFFVTEPAYFLGLPEPDHPGEQPDEADGRADQECHAPADRADEASENEATESRAEIGAAIEDGREQRTFFKRNPFSDNAARRRIGGGFA